MDDRGLRSEKVSSTSAAVPGLAAAYANLGLVSLQESRFDEARRLAVQGREAGAGQCDLLGIPGGIARQA